MSGDGASPAARVSDALIELRQIVASRPNHPPTEVAAWFERRATLMADIAEASEAAGWVIDAAEAHLAAATARHEAEQYQASITDLGH